MATRAEVAKLAGVSASTVSYALSGERSIKPETKARVLKAVAELNYVPHFAAGALAGRKAKALALLFSGAELAISPVAMEYITGAANAAREDGYHLILWPSDEVALADIQRFATSGFLSGVLIMEIRLEDERVNTLERLGIPLTMIGRTTQLDNRKYVDRDFNTVANTALNYLQELKHKNVGLMTQVRTHSNDVLGVDSGFSNAILQAAKNNKITITEIPVRNTASAGRAAFSELQKIAPQATALLALPDLATIGFLSAAREFGLDIPEQFSILALNTPDNQLEMAWPPLSTITVPANAMGRAAAKILINHLEGKNDEISQQLWAGELVVRGTTAPAQ